LDRCVGIGAYASILIGVAQVDHGGKKNNRSGTNNPKVGPNDEPTQKVVNHTKNGLVLLIIGYLIAILTAVLGLADVDIHPTINSALAELPKVLMVMGVIFVFIGRKRFGSYHKKFGMLAMGMFIFGILIIMIGTTMIMSEDFTVSDDP